MIDDRDLTVKLAKKVRQSLEQEIAYKLEEFTRTTGLKIESMDLEIYQGLGSNPNPGYVVKIKVTI